MTQTGQDIEIAARILTNSGLVAIPTETVYGLSANALDENAVLKIFEAKNRPFFDPLIIHVHSKETVNKYASFDDDRLNLLAKAFWPGPLTLLLPKKSIIPDIVTSGLKHVAVRVPDHHLTLALLKKTDLPLAAPSANPFGYVSPTQPSHVQKQLGQKVDYILDGGVCSVGLESTIAGIENNELCVYRLGGLPLEDLERIAGTVTLKINSSSDPKAPGQLKSHYAPKKPLYLGNISELFEQHKTKKIAVICFGENNLHSNNATIFNLSETGSIREAAVNLFSFLRLADESDTELVIAGKLPEEGLGRAINDRLQRAAVK